MDELKMPPIPPPPNDPHTDETRPEVGPEEVDGDGKLGADSVPESTVR
jgi:hypothetical protein